MQQDKGYCENCLESKESIFSLLTDEQKKILNDRHTCTSYKKGEIIYKEGDKPNGLICLSKGKVKVIKEGVGGREQIVRMSKPVGFIGYRALFAGNHYISSAVAIEDSQICMIERDALFEVIRQNGDLALAMLRAMAIELGFSNERTVTLTQKHIRGRLAEALLFLADTFGYEDDSQTIKIYLSREDIANLSNMTTSNAIRTLSSFAHENVIALDGRKIKVLELNQLKRISSLG